MMWRHALPVLGAATAAAVNTMEIKGNRFVDSSSGDALQIVGAAYQPGGSDGFEPAKGVDPLSNSTNCLRDAALMQQLGVNTIRVYNLSPDINHDDCASIFNAAGMYMLIDVNSPLPGEALNSLEPWTTYDEDYLNRTFAIVENFKNYPNLLGFFAGNEVINNVATGAKAPPYVRAVTRDLKNYIKNNADRQIPVGYSAADVRTVLEDTANYFTCAIDGDSDDMSRADMFALNSYSWCGDSSFTESGYDQLVAMFENSSVPVFYSEFGCNTPSPRVFTEIQAIYGDQMTPTFSGGVVYEYAQEENNYGLATINDDGSVKLLDDYDTLKSQYAKINFDTLEGTKATSASTSFATCKSSLITEAGFSNNFTLPAVPSGVQSLINNGISGKTNGKIVDISDYSVTNTVKNADGSTMSSLSVKPLASGEINTPTAANSSSSSSSGSGGKSAAPRAAQTGLTMLMAVPLAATVLVYSLL
ncbi:beta-glucanosyltransferase gel2 [Xylariaceae sp. FL0804]|nr:beta-glucanosyltransferase gel2 [Xylariaceae sp. FL0804]